MSHFGITIREIKIILKLVLPIKQKYIQWKINKSETQPLIVFFLVFEKPGYVVTTERQKKCFAFGKGEFLTEIGENNKIT